MSYKKVFGTNLIQRIKDSSFIPPDPDNKDYIEYLLYLQKGGIVYEAEIPIIDNNKEIDTFFSTPVFSSIIEALAKSAKVDIETIKIDAKNILNNKVK